MVFATIIGALLPVVVTLLLGLFSAWHHDFAAEQATVLNRMVMQYALPLTLFTGTLGISPGQLRADLPLALIVAIGMVGAFFATLVLAHWIFRRDLGTSSLQALAVGAPAVPFVGVSVLGYLFGGSAAAAVPIAVASIAMTLLLLPLTLVFLETKATSGGAGFDRKRSALLDDIARALGEPMVWAPILGLVLVIAGVRFPPPITGAFLLLGQATGGVALFAAGIVLYSRRLSMSKPIVVSTLARNIAVPAAAWGIVVSLGLSHQVIREAVLTLSVPVPSACIILAVQYHTAEQEMASTLFFSTVLSFLTMGAFIWLMG
jgi:malonate transporter